MSVVPARPQPHKFKPSLDVQFILFVMAKAGEVSPLVQALEEHGTDYICKAVSKLLTLSCHNSGIQTAGGTPQP
jgi:hypothetical protein